MNLKYSVTRIFAVGGLIFCTTLLASGFDTITAIINALLISLVAIFTEIAKEEEAHEKTFLGKTIHFIDEALVL